MKRYFAYILLFIIVSGVSLHTFSLYRDSQENELIVYGNVDVRQVDLGFRVNGRVEKMLFDEGDYIKPGTLMASLEKQPYLDLCQQKKANIESIRASIKIAKELVDRRLPLIESGAISQEEYDNAKSNVEVLEANLKAAYAELGVALTNLKDTDLYAPQEGTILTRIREPGTVVNIADPIYTLSILSPVWVRAYIAEPYLGVVYPGMSADVYTDTKNGKVYKGHVCFISTVSEFTPKTVQTTDLRTDLVYRIRVIVDDPDRCLKQGMPVTVKLQKNSITSSGNKKIEYTRTAG